MQLVVAFYLQGSASTRYQPKWIDYFIKDKLTELITYLENIKCDSGYSYNEDTKQCYKYQDEGLDFDNARDGCKMGHQSSDLTSIHSAEEEQFILGNITNIIVTIVPSTAFLLS